MKSPNVMADHPSHSPRVPPIPDHRSTFCVIYSSYCYKHIILIVMNGGSGLNVTLPFQPQDAYQTILSCHHPLLHIRMNFAYPQRWCLYNQGIQRVLDLQVLPFQFDTKYHCMASGRLHEKLSIAMGLLKWSNKR